MNLVIMVVLEFMAQFQLYNLSASIGFVRLDLFDHCLIVAY